MKPAARPLLRGDTTRDALLTAAITCFARDRFRATSLRGIAEAAGINPALIGCHFRSKEGLHLAAFADIVKQIRQRLDPIAEEIALVLALSEESSDQPTLTEGYLAS